MRERIRSRVALRKDKRKDENPKDTREETKMLKSEKGQRVKEEWEQNT